MCLTMPNSVRCNYVAGYKYAAATVDYLVVAGYCCKTFDIMMVKLCAYELTNECGASLCTATYPCGSVYTV